MAISEELSLDISKALAEVNRLERQLTSVLARVDARPLTTAIDGAIGAAHTSVTVTGSAAELTGDIDAAVQAATTSVTVTGEAGELTGDVDAAIDAAHTEVTVTGDASELTGAIDAAVQAADTQVTITGDVGGGSFGQLEDGISGATLAAGGLGVALGSLGGIATAAVGAVATKKVLDFANSTIQAASDVVEATNLVNVVFEEAADSVLRFSETSATSVGLARDQAEQAAASFGGLFIGLGQGRKEAADLSVSVVKLAADLTSAKNIAGGVPEALTVLRSALVGEIEPIRRLGVAFNAAQVEAKAVALGLADANGTISESAKVSARYALIVEQLGRQGVLGDFARTSEDLANSQRIAAASFRDTKAAIGEALLPVALELVTLFKTDVLPLLTRAAEVVVPLLAKSFDAVSPALQGVLQALSLLVTVATPFLAVIEKIPAPLLQAVAAFVALRLGAAAVGGALNLAFTAIANMIVPTEALAIASLDTAGAMGAEATAARGLSSVFNPLTLAIGLGVTALLGWQAEHREAKQRALEFRDAIVDDTKALDDNTGALNDNVNAIVRHRLESKNQIDDLARAGVTFDEVRRGIAGSDADFRKLLDNFAKAGEFGPRFVEGITGSLGDFRHAALTSGQANNGLILSLFDLRDGFRSGQRAVADLAAAEGDAAASTDAFGRTVQHTGNQVVDLANKLGLGQVAIDSFNDVLGGFNIAPDLADSLLNVGDAITEVDSAGRTLNPEKVTRNLEQIADRIRKVDEDTADSLRDFDRSVTQAVDSLADSWSSKIPDATQGLTSALAEVDKALQAQVERNSFLARKFRVAVSDNLNLDQVVAELDRQAAQIARFFDNIATLAAQGLDDTVQVLLERGPEAGAALANALVGGSAQQRQAFEGAVQGFDAQARRGDQLIRDLVNELPAGVSAAAEAARVAFESKFHIALAVGTELDRVRAAFVDQLDALAAQAKQEAAKVGGGIADGLSSSGGAIRKAAKKVTLDDVIKGLRDDTEEIAQFYADLKTLAGKGLDDTVEVLLRKGPKAGAELARSLAAAGAAQQQAFERTVDGFKEEQVRAYLIATDLAAKLPSTFDRIAADITRKFDEGLDLAGISGKEAEAARVTLRNVLSSGDTKRLLRDLGIGIGGALDQGIALGIAQGVTAVVTAVTDIANAVILSALDAFDIGSPSKVFAGIGETLMTSLAGGVKAAGPVAFTAIDSVIAAGIQQVTPAFPSVSLPPQSFPGAPTGTVRNLAGGTQITLQQTINNPKAETVPETTTTTLRRAQYLLGI